MHRHVIVSTTSGPHQASAASSLSPESRVAAVEQAGTRTISPSAKSDRHMSQPARKDAHCCCSACALARQWHKWRRGPCSSSVSSASEPVSTGCGGNTHQHEAVTPMVSRPVVGSVSVLAMRAASSTNAQRTRQVVSR